MKSNLTIKRGAVRTAPVGPAGLAGRILAGAVALLLIWGVLGGRAWAITGGEVDEANAYPNIGAIVIALPGYEPFVGASGTLIHPRVLLTAGHVTQFMLKVRPETIPYTYVSFGTYALDPTTWTNEIEAVITHPNYWNPAHFANDVGVIILKQPIAGVPLAKMPDAGLLDYLNEPKALRLPGQGGVPFRVVGYGGGLTRNPPVATFPGDGWRRFGDSEFLNVLPGWLLLQQNFSTGNDGAGYGDSGGPVFWVQPDGTRVMVGITSWGDVNCVAMNFYWRADIPATLDFISSVVQGLEQ